MLGDSSRMFRDHFGELQCFDFEREFGAHFWLTFGLFSEFLRSVETSTQIWKQQKVISSIPAVKNRERTFTLQI